MEDRYSKFKKLNQLLEESFEAERVYYNAGEDVQEISLKRFFNHETVKRNRFSQEISEKLVQAGVEPHKMWVNKGNLDRGWKEEKKALTKRQPLKLLNKCTSSDEKNLQRYNEIIDDNKLSTEILSILKKQRNFIVQSLQEAEKLRTSLKGPEPANEPKVRKLRAM